MIRTSCSCGATLDVDHGSAEAHRGTAPVHVDRERKDIATFTRAHRACRRPAAETAAVNADLAAARADREKVLVELEDLRAKHQALRDAIAQAITHQPGDGWPPSTQLVLVHVANDLTGDQLDDIADAVRRHAPAGLWDIATARTSDYIPAQRLRDAIEEA